MSYDSDESMFEQRSLSKNNINAIRRSQVGSPNQFSHCLYFTMIIVVICSISFDSLRFCHGNEILFTFIHLNI